MNHADLFGGETPLTSQAKRHDPTPYGYARPPGTGPAGETCGTCEHHVIKRMAKNYHKCALAKAKWTGGRKSDILVRSPACSAWIAEASVSANEGR